MKKQEKRVSCDWCGVPKSAPLRLSNMFIDKDAEVRVICSQCVLSTPARDLFSDEGPIPWPARFYRSTSQKVAKVDWELGLGITILLLAAVACAAMLRMIYG